MDQRPGRRDGTLGEEIPRLAMRGEEVGNLPAQLAIVGAGYIKGTGPRYPEAVSRRLTERSLAPGPDRRSLARLVCSSRPVANGSLPIFAITDVQGPGEREVLHPTEVVAGGSFDGDGPVGQRLLELNVER